ncbi:MAG: dihydrofolate reductase family protein [Chloroflexota bacterium]
MRKIIYSMMVSLDGFAARPNGDLDWGLIDEEIHTFVNNQQREIGTYLHGRKMHEVMKYWETADQDLSSPAYELEFAKIWQNMPKIIFSNTLEEVRGNATLFQGDIATKIGKLKQQPGKNMGVGGSTLAATFFKLGLIDEVGLFVHPVVLGSGIPFFPALDSPLNLQLVEKRPFQSGVVYLRYQRSDLEQG